MSNIFYDQAEFMDAGDIKHPCREDWACDFAAKCVDEEILEWQSEMPGTANDLKESIDLIYVVAQYVNMMYGPENATKAWERVHNNNMSKCIKGKLRKREDGKILKPEGYKPVDLLDLSMV